MPYLVNSALRLADACDKVDAAAGSAALEANNFGALQHPPTTL